MSTPTDAPTDLYVDLINEVRTAGASDDQVATIRAAIELADSVAEPRPIENIRPGAWFRLNLVPHDEPEKVIGHIWLQCVGWYDLIHEQSGNRVIQLIGIPIDGGPALDYMQVAGFALSSLRAARARSAGLAVLVR